MGSAVYANGMSIACKAADGKTIAAMPDVCLSPPTPPAGPIPVPYPNTAMASDTTKGSKTVQIGGQEVMLKDQSTFKKSTGDEAATKTLGMGVVSHQIQGEVNFAAWSMDVKFEGENVPRHLDITLHNEMCIPANTPPWPYIDRMAMAMVKDCDQQREDVKNACDPWEEKAKCPSPKAVQSAKSHNLGVKAGFGKDSVEHNKSKEVVKVAFEQFADMVEDNECQKKLRCVFVPYEKNSKKMCCQNQTPHHVVEASSFLEAGSRAGNPIPIEGWGNYDDAAAPCVCVEGENQTTSTHGQMHLRQGVVSANKMDSNGMWSRAEATDTGVEAVCKTFPDSECDADCLKAQLDAYHDKACTSDPEKPIRAISTMAEDEQARSAAADEMGVPWPPISAE